MEPVQQTQFRTELLIRYSTMGSDEKITSTWQDGSRTAKQIYSEPFISEM